MDSQFVEPMGSPYLIAHGLGVPVSNASGSVSFPETGDYEVWVRTRNWVPSYSNDAAPGRFRVLFDGAELAPVFGAADGAWRWHSGGTVTVASATATVGLADLTGFDGRCDAIAFVGGTNSPPPDGGAALAEWRRTALGEPTAPAVTQSLDCVIVGGGMAGCCAALASARSGLRVALVQDRPVLGGNASQEIRVATRGEIRNSIVDEIDTTDLGNQDGATADADVARLATIQTETNIVLLMPWRAYGAGTNGSGRVAYVDARQTATGERRRLQAPIFIDCTGDGWIGYWAGAEYRTGREAASEFGESRAPAVADAKTMGNSLMWTTQDLVTSNSFPGVPWAMDVAGSRSALGGGWNWEYGMSLSTIQDAEAIRDHLLRAIYGNFYNAKQDPANASIALEWVPYVAGKRESRRLMGDHLLTQVEVQNGVYFEDAVGTATWGIDLHYETAVSYLSNYTSTAVKKWYFPFRCLYSRNVPNLMMAGRCISVTHAGLGSPRVMNTCGQMGVAVGYAAAICREYGIEPRDIYRSVDRTVELQARITGAWPQRPAPVAAVLDNTNAAPAVTVVGDWVSSAYTAGYYGTNYLHDNNAGQGAKRVAFTPTLTYPGTYAIALRWAEGSNRASNTPVWVCSTPLETNFAAAAATCIRNTQTNSVYSGGDVQVGRLAAGDYMRGLLQFDLASIPTGAVAVSAELQLTISMTDTSTVAGPAGADGLRVYSLTRTFAPTETTWSRWSSTNLWTSPGGDFETNALGTITDPPDPNQAATGDVFVFPRTAALTGAVGSALRQHAPLSLLVRTPSLESTYPARKVYRFGSAALAVKYFVPRLPANYTVNQRAQGGLWVTLGTHEYPADGFTVIVGNDGANGYVIADAVQFSNATASTNDYDGDGLSDTFERYYFFSQTAADPAADTDGDGRSNFVEAMTGTDPLDPASRYDMRVALDAVPSTVVLRWPSASNLTYRVEASEVLTNGFRLLVSGIGATPPENSYPVAQTNAHEFYRIVLEP